MMVKLRVFKPESNQTRTKLLVDVAGCPKIDTRWNIVFITFFVFYFHTWRLTNDTRHQLNQSPQKYKSNPIAMSKLVECIVRAVVTLIVLHVTSCADDENNHKNVHGLR